MRLVRSAPANVRKIVTGASLLALAVLSVVGCGDQRYGGASIVTADSRVAMCSSGHGSEIAMSRQWAAEGARLIKFKASMLKNLPAHLPAPANTGSYAYQSQPVDITKAGNYILNFGPVDAKFDYPNSPQAVVFDFPPDTKFSVTPAGNISMVTLNGKRYLQAEVAVTNFSAPYCSLTGWIY
jgi:hypothetical protein